MMTSNRVSDVRELFKSLKAKGEYVTDKTGCKMLEIIGATFLADEPAIFGTLNEDYAKRELAWYDSMSLNVNDIPGGPPQGWKSCASKNGLINSNYGWMIWSGDNCAQYGHVRDELRRNPESRRAVMIYTRPTMWIEYNRDGMSDFVCTNASQFMIRDGKLVAIVQMRSNDVVFGYKNDRYWHLHVQSMLAHELNVPVGDLIWHAGSLHVYERHFDLIA